MASYNRVVLVGNITRDIELRHTPGGTAVTDIGMAINDRRKGQNGEWVEEVTFVDVTLWGRTAEVAGEYLGKGAPILVEGRLKLDTWEVEGQKKSKLRVVCERMQMLGGRSGGGSGSGGGGYEEQSSAPRSNPPANSPASQSSNGGSGYGETDIPF
ncbi:Single-stranded DNA-binding protein [Roseimaritima multifibrata]|uniref:Single-stranded DNA-binding protein n=1 Tax=Roseimaritima multifibrata TaxID=1930274 RepID=A0A517MCR1_9BACT|nr:single-stranded DNA-binding protein [Roseimaritima multifibrata]QDS92680.1 Single-stranded DNA-binding protein [Roseimaritima multifibrata]